MGRDKADDKERGMLKRMRRARGGRTLPRSGGGVHEDKKSKKVERQMAEEADDEIKNWQQNADEDLLDEIEDNADILDDEFWDEWQFPELHEDYEPEESLTKDKEKKDASTD